MGRAIARISCVVEPLPQVRARLECGAVRELDDQASGQLPGLSACRMISHLIGRASRVGQRGAPATSHIRGDRGNDIATFRWGRLGGSTEADVQVGHDPYQAVGAVTVAGGHAEAAMNRILIVAEDRKTFADVDLP